MRKIKQLLIVTLTSIMIQLLAMAALAFPTKTIEVPDDRVQKDRLFRFDSEVDFTLDKRSADAGALPPSINEGVTFGAFDNYTVGGEIGFEWWEPQAQDNLRCPHLNGKFIVHEEEKFPGVAFGFYNFGFKSNTTDENILYLGLGKTFQPGHFFIGYSVGNQNVLVDERGNGANQALLLSWERPFPTIGKNFSLMADFQSSNSRRGALSFGPQWRIQNSGTISLGYSIYNNRNFANLRDTLDVQLSLQL